MCGWGDSGRTGLGHTNEQSTFKHLQVSSGNKPLPKIRSVSCGTATTVYFYFLFTQDKMVLTQDGDVYICGWNDSGRLGLGSSGCVDRLTKISQLHDIVDIKTDERSQIVLQRNGDVWVWGCSDTLGLKRTADPTDVPVKIEKIKNVMAIAAGGFSYLIRTVDGDVYGTGNSNYLWTKKKTKEFVLIKRVSKRNGFVGFDTKSRTCAMLLQNKCLLWTKAQYMEINIPQGHPKGVVVGENQEVVILVGTTLYYTGVAKFLKSENTSKMFVAIKETLPYRVVNFSVGKNFLVAIEQKRAFSATRIFVLSNDSADGKCGLRGANPGLLQEVKYIKSNLSATTLSCGWWHSAIVFSDNNSNPYELLLGESVKKYWDVKINVQYY